MKGLSIIVACVLGVALTSCTGSESPQRRDGQTAHAVTSRDGHSKLLTYHLEPEDPVNFALFKEGLALNRKGCFAFASNGATIVVPDTWTIGAGGQSLTSADGKELHLGEQFTAGGGYLHYNRDTVPDAFRSCPGELSPADRDSSPYSRMVGIYDIQPSVP